MLSHFPPNSSVWFGLRARLPHEVLSFQSYADC
jgi:hypothetical protein